jgi:PAS domain S-box-containing protein
LKVLHGVGQQLSIALERARQHDHLEQLVLERTAALTESEQRYSSLFAHARDGIVLIDADSGLVDDCNLEFEKQCGRPLDELRHLHIQELSPPGQREVVRRKFEEIKAAGEGGASELDFERPDGTRLPIEFASSRIRIGDRDYLQSISRDISERKQAESVFAAQLEELRRWHDTTLGREGRILELKHEVNELLGQAGQPLRYPSAESSIPKEE